MFIPLVSQENLAEDEFKSLYKNKYNKSNDIESCKRTIILHDDYNPDKSNLEGCHIIKCTIINLSVLSGKFHEAVYSPERILVKTIYNGYVIIPLNVCKTDKLEYSEEVLEKSKFKLVNAYTSYIGLWSVYQENDNFAAFGISVLDMVDLKNALLNSNTHVSMYGEDIAIKMDISFDGSNYQTILPIPMPQYYSKVHSEINGDEPTITKIVQIPFSDLCDENTKIKSIKFAHKIIGKDDIDFEYNKKSSVEFINNDGSILVQKEGVVPTYVVFNLLRSLSDELYSKIFKIFSRYQLSSINFISDVNTNQFVIPSMTFSYDSAPKHFAETVIQEIVLDEEILKCFENMRIIYGDIRIIGRITDLKYDLTIMFTNGHKDLPQIKYVKYHNSIFDIWGQMLNMETNVSTPITSYYI